MAQEFFIADITKQQDARNDSFLKSVEKAWEMHLRTGGSRRVTPGPTPYRNLYVPEFCPRCGDDGVQMIEQGMVDDPADNSAPESSMHQDVTTWESDEGVRCSFYEGQIGRAHV